MPVGERNVGVGGGTLDAGLVADVVVGGAQCGEEWRVGGKFAAGPGAEHVDFPLELPFRAIARGFHFVANAGGDAFAQRGFELAEFVFAFGAYVDF